MGINLSDDDIMTAIIAIGHLVDCDGCDTDTILNANALLMKLDRLMEPELSEEEMEDIRQNGEK